MRLTPSCRRDRRGVLSPLYVAGDVSEHEERATRMCPVQRLRQWNGIAIRLEQRVVAALGVGLQNAGEVLQMAAPDAPVACRARHSRAPAAAIPAERPVISDIGPYVDGS